jgi:hypothetical protein
MKRHSSKMSQRIKLTILSRLSSKCFKTTFKTKPTRLRRQTSTKFCKIWRDRILRLWSSLTKSSRPPKILHLSTSSKLKWSITKSTKTRTSKTMKMLMLTTSRTTRMQTLILLFPMVPTHQEAPQRRSY